MPGKFLIKGEVGVDTQPWGTSRWLSNPGATGATHLTVIEGDFSPGEGHAFHQHPDQEELLLVLAGTVEHWIEGEKRILGPGDAAFMPPGLVHGSHNVGKDVARLVAIFGPSVGPYGIGTVDVFAEAPWNRMRVAATA